MKSLLLTAALLFPCTANAQALGNPYSYGALGGAARPYSYQAPTYRAPVYRPHVNYWNSGNMTFGSDGTSVTRLGNSYFGSSGRSCQVIGAFAFCN